MNYTALILAAGKGKRTGLGYNKMFYFLKKYQQTVLEKSTNLFLHDPRCKQIIIVTNPHDMHSVVRGNENEKITHVNGGITRRESVLMGLMAVKEDVVLIHDGARPWLDEECVNRLLIAMESEKAAVLAVKLKDIIKRVENGYVVSTIDRLDLLNIQTPQAFDTNLILKVYSKADRQNLNIIDDAQALELIYPDVPIKVVDGSYLNNKITTIDDIKNNKDN